MLDGAGKTCCISHHFFRSASENPNLVAVVHAACEHQPSGAGDEPFTYSHIASAVDSLSRRIRQVLDGGEDPHVVRPKDFNHVKQTMAVAGSGHTDSAKTYDTSFSDRTPQIIGVYIEPSAEYIVAVLSILRCREAFLPLDPLWPEERITLAVSSSRTRLIIQSRRRLDTLHWIVDKSSCSVLYLSMKDCLNDQFSQSDLIWPCESRSPRNFCYLMYTSGSTGKPKGVCGTEKGKMAILWNKNFKCNSDLCMGIALDWVCS